jgi:hypothetical protein
MADLNDPDMLNEQIDDIDDRLWRGICQHNSYRGLSLPHALFYAASRWSTADCEFTAIWTAVLYDTATSAHPQHFQTKSYYDGWVEFTTDSGLSMIWLPAERRSSELTAVAASHSRLVIGGGNEAMTMIARSQ